MVHCVRMSLWRVKHTLSPALEASVIALALAYGVFAVYLSSLHPLAVQTTAGIRALSAPIDLDTDHWLRSRNEARGYLYAIPPSWRVADDDPDRVVLGANEAVAAGRRTGPRIVIEAHPLRERGEAVNVAVADLFGTRPALYDVTVHGRPGLFAVRFDGRRLVEQTVYVETGRDVLVFRGGDMEPEAFSAFLSTVKFLPETENRDP